MLVKEREGNQNIVKCSGKDLHSFQRSGAYTGSKMAIDHFFFFLEILPFKYFFLKIDMKSLFSFRFVIYQCKAPTYLRRKQTQFYTEDTETITFFLQFQIPP